jgi:hypothetical protein
MLFSREVPVIVRHARALDRVPFGAILQRWIWARFDREACRASLDEIVRARGIEDLLRPEGVTAGDAFAREALLFPAMGRRTARFGLGSAPRTLTVDDAALGWMARLVRSAALGDAAGCDEALAALGSEPLPSLLPRDPPRQPWPSASIPGVYRREHASVLIRSRRTRILIDPVALLGRGLPHLDTAPRTTRSPRASTRSS